FPTIAYQRRRRIRFLATVRAYFPPKQTARRARAKRHPVRWGLRGWANSSAFAKHANRSRVSVTRSVRLKTAFASDARRANVPSTPHAQRKLHGITNNIGLNRETIDEISSSKALHRHRRSQDQRQSRRCLLEGTEGDRRRPRHDSLGACRRNRFGPPSW